ncbi:uncharacterized protein LOC110845285 isoform X2 [Folsomia candida]|uniref:uncharacterized protein LOC110845285 isoform X2 n=1 Tax=Folsomia candida TaxID=158441 RepID=UPI001604BAAC|nr:uncharacterized protein LOC110845285 isoform X2 [Folsomia candida]
MSSSIRLGEPVQIVNFKLLPSQPSRLVLQKKLLSQILKEVGNTPICLISIAGASRQGKSFLLTVVLNALECLSRGQTDYWEDLDRLNGLSGFHFKNGTERDTVGLWLWSKPFIITKSDNTKIAVMLMDTQGVFDSYTTERDWAMIVGLSLLTSSCLIYNLFNNMQEDTLKIFHNFVEFGMLSLEEDSTATSAFQKLVFLIRDWNFPNTHSYGPLGGSNFLEKKLAVTPDMPPEVTKKTLVTCFEEIFCFLMPNPGEAAKDNNFSGALGLLNEAFRDNLRLFVDNLISYDDLKPIKIGNNIIDGTSLISYFEKYVEVFNGKTIPQPKSLYQAMEEARLGSCITKCCNQAKEKLEKVQKSCKYIPNNEFKQYCDKFGKEALTEFMAEGNKTKNQEFVQRHRAILLSDLKTLFGDIFATNETSNKSILNKILDVSLAQFKSILAEKTRQTLLEQDLEDILETEAKKIMLKVRQDCEGWDATFQKEAETKIKELIDTENTAIRGQNSTKFKELEHLCQTSLQTCTQEYNSLMNLALGNDVKNVTEEKLSQTHKKCESIVLPKFMGSLANESEIIQGHFRHQFNTGINQILEQYAEKFSTARNEASSAAKNIYDESYTAYITAMTALAESGTASESDLKTEHRFKVLEACQTLNQIQIICSSEEAKEFENKMRQETTQFCDELIASIHNEKERFQSLLDQAVKNAVETYDQEIKSAVLSTADVPLSNEDFVNKHEKILGKILSKVSVSDWIPAENRSTVENKIRQGVQKLYQDAQSSNNCNLEKAELTALEKSKTFLATYDERMDALVSRVAPPVQKTELASTHKKLEQEIGKTAKKTFANFPKYIVDRIWGKLQLDMNSRFEDYKEKLALKVKQNQTKMSQLVSDYVEMYLSEMDNLRSTVKNITDADLVRFHEHSKSKNMRHLTNILRLNENLDEGKVQKELNEKLEQVFSEIQQDASDLYKATNTKISELCNTAKVNYQKAIEKNRAQNEEELKKIHETVLSTVLDEFERSFTEIGDMQRFRQEKVALQADLQDLHGKSVNNFLDQHDKKSRQEINELLENYKKQVQSQLDQFYCVSDSKLRALHDHAFSELLSNFQQLVTIPSNLNSKTYDDLLIQKINEAFKLFESENIAKNKSLRKTIQNRVVQLSKELVAELNTMNYIDDTTLRKITTKYIQF